MFGSEWGPVEQQWAQAVDKLTVHANEVDGLLAKSEAENKAFIPAEYQKTSSQPTH